MEIIAESVLKICESGQKVSPTTTELNIFERTKSYSCIWEVPNKHRIMCECLQTLLMRLTAKMPEASQKTSAELMFKVGRFEKNSVLSERRQGKLLSEAGQSALTELLRVSLLLATKDGGNLKVKKTKSTLQRFAGLVQYRGDPGTARL